MGGEVVSIIEVRQKSMLPRKGCAPSQIASRPLDPVRLYSARCSVFKGLGCYSLREASRRPVATFPRAECSGTAFSFVSSKVLLELWG